MSNATTVRHSTMTALTGARPKGYLPGTTAPENLKRIDAMFKKLGFQMNMLYQRWDCEKGHEAIADYAEPIRKALPSGFTLLKMTSRPFGFQFSVEGEPNKVYQFTATFTRSQWKRVK